MKNCRCKNNLKYNLCRIYRFVVILIIFFLIVNYIVKNSSIYYRKLYYSPISLQLNMKDLVLAKGEEYKLHVNRPNKRVSYSSTNFRVAGVNFNGRVYAYRTGKAYIIAKVSGKKLICRVRVLDINKSKLSLSVGKSYRIKIYGSAGFPSYKSSNPKVATINWRGKVKAKKPGKTTITVKARGKYFTCTVIVR